MNCSHSVGVILLCVYTHVMYPWPARANGTTVRAKQTPVRMSITTTDVQRIEALK